MEKAYTPTKKEVIKEMWNESIRNISEKVITPITTGLGYFLVTSRRNISEKVVPPITTGLGYFLVANTIPYIFPSGNRIAKEDKTPVEPLSTLEKASFYFGLTGLLAQVGGYTQLCKEGYPESLLIPFATNLFSGVYELGRKDWKRAEQTIRARNIERSEEDSPSERLG